MRIAFYGSSLVSAYWNGAATYYRGIIRALAGLGHQVTFFEPDACERQKNRDIDDPEWARVRVYANSEDAALEVIAEAAKFDVIVKASGVGVFDELLERELLLQKHARNSVVFWDVDAPATLDRIQQNEADPFRALVPRFDAVFTYGGGQPVIAAYEASGARACIPIYNALDPETHHPVAPVARFGGDLAFLGNRLPDRERRVEEFFLKPAAALPEMSFLLGGAGWETKAMPANIQYLNHVYTADHNAFNCTPRVVLNVSRDSMARYGFSPATRVFEAAGAAACVLTDWWEGVDQFFDPGHEILVARSGDEVTEQLRQLGTVEARAIGSQARRRALAEHTYRHRAEQVDRALEGMACSLVRS